MAIQLDCPACFQSLRVPDSAMETVIACPHCRSRLRVPAVVIPAAMATTAFETPVFATPAFAPPETTAGDSPFLIGSEENDGAGAPATTVNPHAALARRNKRRMSRAWMGVILAFVLATIGTSGVWWWSNSQNVVRRSSATVVANATLSKDLTPLDVNVLPADWGALTRSLEVNPVDLTDSKMKVQFGSGSRGLQLSLTPTSERILVAVPTASIEELQDPAVQTALVEAWKLALSQGITEMSRTVQDAVAAGVPPKLGGFGDVVGLEGLAGPIGYHFRGAVGTTAYPCVFEDANRQLYFLVPPGTQSLAVIPREIGARNRLPAKMRITATVK